MHIQEIREIARNRGISQSQLSKRSGVSRAQINRLFSGTGAARESTLLRLAEALSISEKDLESHRKIESFKAVVRAQVARKSFAGLGLPELHDQPLESFFVSQHATAHPLHDQTYAPLSPAETVGRDTFQDCSGKSQTQPATDLIGANPRVVILGCPGAGKSTLLQYLVSQLVAKEPETEHPSNDLPVLIRLSEFATAMDSHPQLDFLDWASSWAEANGCHGILPELQRLAIDRKSSLYFLLDGLDEVPTANGLRQRVVDAAESFIETYPLNRYVVASRVVGFDGSIWKQMGFDAYRLIEYGDAQIQEAVQKWVKLIGPRTGSTVEETQGKLLDAIMSNVRVRQIAANPLVLTILIFLSLSRGNVLPRRRVDLYRKVAEVFLDSWEASKGQSTGYDELFAVDLDVREINWLIAELALGMQREGLVTAKRWWIAEHLQNTLCNRVGFDQIEAKQQTDTIIRFVSQRTGLLEERTPGLFAFSHRTLQEYFAACGLVDEAELDDTPDLPGLIEPILFHPEWAEVIRLTTAQITPTRADKIFRLLLGDSSPSGRFLYRGPILALHCLADGTTIADRQVTESLFQQIQELGRSRWLGITLEALDAMNDLSGTRLQRWAKETIDRMISMAESELSQKEIETLKFAAHCDQSNPDVRGLQGDIAKSSVLVASWKLGELRREIHLPNMPLFTDSPKEWHALAKRLLDDSAISLAAKHTALSQMGMVVKQNNLARIRLKKILTDPDANTSLRCISARLLGSLGNGPHTKRHNLVEELDRTSNPMVVREACAMALFQAAENWAEARERLRSLLENESNHEDLRASAAWALEDAATKDLSIAKMLLQAAEHDSSESVSVAAIGSLEGVSENEQFCEPLRRFAFQSDFRTRPACSVLVNLLVEERIPWDVRLADRIENVIRSIGEVDQPFGDPCPHALACLQQLVDHRERIEYTSGQANVLLNNAL